MENEADSRQRTMMGTYGSDGHVLGQMKMDGSRPQQHGAFLTANFLPQIF